MAFVVGTFLCRAQHFLESLVEQLCFILFGFDRLAENVLFALVLLTHGLGGCFEIFEGPFTRRRRMREDSPAFRVDPQDRPAVGTGDIKWLERLSLHGWEHSRTFVRRGALPFLPDTQVDGPGLAFRSWVFSRPD